MFTKFFTSKPMPERPPMMPNTPPEKELEDMTLQEIEGKIGELTVDLDNAAKSNQGTRELEGILAQIINERAKYEMRRQEILHNGSGR
jgi:hypothetical protein